MTTAMFSVLLPHKHIPPHRGPWKGVLRYHLALRTPADETTLAAPNRAFIGAIRRSSFIKRAVVNNEARQETLGATISPAWSCTSHRAGLHGGVSASACVVEDAKYDKDRHRLRCPGHCVLRLCVAVLVDHQPCHVDHSGTVAIPHALGAAVRGAAHLGATLV